MKYRKFIDQSPLVSEIGLGTWQLGDNTGWSNMAESDALAMVHKAIELGINFFDTAPNYGNGTSEIRLGKAISSYDRSKLVINTKFGHTVSGGIDFDPDHIRCSLEGSLNRLRMEYVDSLIIHNPPFINLDGRKNKHYEVLESMKKEGKIRAYGASVDTFDEMKLLMDTTGSKVIEAFFNILHQDVEGAFDIAHKNGVGIIAKIPLDSGWLSGKYDKDSTFTGVRKRWTKNDIKIRAKLVKTIEHLIGNGNSLAQSALSFCLSFNEISTVIPGNTSVSQLIENIKSSNMPLSEEIKNKLQEYYKSEIKELNIPW